MTTRSFFDTGLPQSSAGRRRFWVLMKLQHDQRRILQVSNMLWVKSFLSALLWSFKWNLKECAILFITRVYHLPHSKFIIRITNIVIVWPTGARLVVDTVDLEPNGTAVLVSQTYNRSSDGKSRCLRFRYMLRGSGDKTLTIFQKTGIYREIPIWTWKGNSGRDWIYGEVPLTSTTKFKVISKLRNLL